LHLLGLVVIARGRRLREALLLVLPLIVVSLFNAFGFWPFGEFRTNLFTLAYAAPLACMAFDWPGKRRLQNLAMAPALCLIFVPLFTFESDWNRRKDYFAGSSVLPQEARALLDLQGRDYKGPAEPLVLDSSACAPWRYYTGIRPGHERLSDAVAQRFHVQCQHRRDAAIALAERRLQRRASRVWVILNNGRTLADIKPELDARQLKVVESRTVREDFGLVLALERSQARSRR
jgi:hypothetical protein